MIGAFVALVVVAIIFMFVIPWAGIVIGIVALLLLIGWLVGFGRSAARAQRPSGPPPP